MSNHLSVQFGDSARRYTYKNDDPTIIIGDIVDVDARGITRTARVVEIGVALDPNARFEYKSIIGKVLDEEEEAPNV